MQQKQEQRKSWLNVGKLIAPPPTTTTPTTTPKRDGGPTLLVLLILLDIPLQPLEKM